MKSPENPKQWIQDEEPAQVVYEIGLYVMDGFGPTQIAKKLTARKLLLRPLIMKAKELNFRQLKMVHLMLGTPLRWRILWTVGWSIRGIR